MRKYLKWSLIMSVPLVGIAVLSALLYVMAPLIISSLTGVEVTSDLQETTDAQPTLKQGLTELYLTIQTLLAMITMIFIILGGILAFVAMVIASIMVIKSGTSLPIKLLWLVLFWFLLGLIGVVIYYFFGKKD